VSVRLSLVLGTERPGLSDSGKVVRLHSVGFESAGANFGAIPYRTEHGGDGGENSGARGRRQIARIRNRGEPLRLEHVRQFDAIMIDTVGPGLRGRTATAGALKSDEPLSHRFVDGIEPVVHQILQNAV